MIKRSLRGPRSHDLPWVHIHAWTPQPLFATISPNPSSFPNPPISGGWHGSLGELWNILKVTRGLLLLLPNWAKSNSRKPPPPSDSPRTRAASKKRGRWWMRPVCPAAALIVPPNGIVINGSVCVHLSSRSNRKITIAHRFDSIGDVSVISSIIRHSLAVSGCHICRPQD